jgi:hypothetical protein
MYMRDPNIPGIVKKNYLKYLYKFETLDAAIPAPLPMLETVSKIFNGNVVRGRQRIIQSQGEYFEGD